MLRAACCAVAVVSLAALPSCQREGCLAGDEDCQVPAACPALDGAFICQDASVEIVQLSDVVVAPGGIDSIGASGDWLLQNDRVQFVIDALDHPQHFSPSGGAILDASTRGDDNDSINHVFQAVGALPTDAVLYRHSRVMQGKGFVAIQFDGHLVADVRQRVYTRYELRACEPGLRVRTEIVNGADDTVVWSNADGSWWGGRSMLPFVPVAGRGLVQPRFGLGTLNDVVVSFPYLVGASYPTNATDAASAFVTVPCNIDKLEGFQSATVSANGTPRRIVTPGDYEVYERFFAVAKGQGAAPGVDVALRLRDTLFHEAVATVQGQLVVVGAANARADAMSNPARASIMVSQGLSGDPASTRIPTTQVVPAANGAFTFDVPANHSYTLEVVAFGERVLVQDVHVGTQTRTLGALEIPAVGHINATVRVDGELDNAQLIVEPARDDVAQRVSTRYFGTGPVCAPQLGPPAGASPSCNRVLVDGVASFALPAGAYHVFATAGLGASIAYADVDVLPGETATIELSLVRHVLPGLSADFHVHGGKSFDSTIPDIDRVRAFLAAGVDVIAATDHDAQWDYRAAMQALNANSRMHLMVGVETTGQMLWKLNPSVYFPQVVGHWIFWPMPFDDEAPRNGAPWDELVEPGALFDRAAARGFDRDTGVIQLNHPWADVEFGRDLGFPRAIGTRLTDPLPRVFDGTGPSLFSRVPDGATFANSDYDAQEVMNSTNSELLLAYRALWFYYLNQGIVKVGTANSDSHSLTDSVLGTPRNIVRTDVTVARWDEVAFNADVKQGHVMGTNGPLITAVIRDGARTLDPGVAAITPAADAILEIAVDSPAWVPVQQVRVVVNGSSVLIRPDAIDRTNNFLQPGLIHRLTASVALSTLLPGTRTSTKDAWIVVEAGAALAATADLDCDGVPDTTDNNGDGDVDYRDVDRNGDGVVSATDVDGVSGPQPCQAAYGQDASVERPDVGPMVYAQPARNDFDNGYAFSVMTPGSFVYAFTNPFVIDRNGDGYQGPGLPP